MTIKLKGSTDGSVSFTAPADTSPSGSDITLTLPTTAGSANQFVKNSGTAGTLEYSSMVETSTGVGIGTSSPSFALDVQKDVNTLGRFIRNTDGSSYVRINSHGGNDVGLQLGDDTDVDKQSITSDNTNNALRFNTANAERVRIDSSGNVGIGTSSPDYDLTVAAGSSATLNVKTTGDDTAPRAARVVWTFSDGDGAAINATRASGDAVTDVELTFRTGGITNSQERMSIGSTGNVILGTATPTQIVAGTHNGKFYQASDSNFISCRATSSSATHQSFFNSNGGVGSITTNASSTSFNTSSDYRLKENVADLDGAIDRVKQLAPKRFNFIADANTTVDGFLAHEAQTVVPEAVTGTHNEVDDDGEPVMQGIDQSKLVPLLTAALQEAIAKIETLETKVAALEAGS